MIATKPQHVEYRAQPKQAEFLNAEEDEVLFGGSAYGGKTLSLLFDAIIFCQAHPRVKTLFIRRTYHDLSLPGSAIDTSRELLTGFARWKAELYTWEFPNGSTLTFGHCENRVDMFQYQGAQLDALYVDELTQITEEIYLFLKSRVRATVDGVIPRTRAATNPGGTGHVWVKKRFIDAAPWGRPFTIYTESGEYVGTARFIPAKAADNRIGMERDPGYINRMRGLPEHLRKAYLDGDWDVFEGQYFDEYRRSKHVCRPFTIPREGLKWRSVDYGIANFFACLWFFQEPASLRIYVYRELYARRLTASQQARAIKLLSKNENIVQTVGDPAMWAKEPNGRSIAAIYASHGINIRRGRKDRLNGWAALHEALRWEDTESQEPALKIFDTCPNLIRTLPAMVHDERRVEDLNSSQEDHLCLSGYTYITTDTGPRLLSQIEVGDAVLTRQGLKHVTAWTRTDPAARVLFLQLSSGQHLLGTPDHPVWVNNRGWVRLDALCPGDILYPEANPDLAGGVSVPVPQCISVRPFPLAIPVFSITVEDAGEFFANGLLVKNCDALRWGVQAVPRRDPATLPIDYRGGAFGGTLSLGGSTELGEARRRILARKAAIRGVG